MALIEYLRGEHFAVISEDAVALCDGRAPAGRAKSLYQAFVGAKSAAAVMRSILALDLGDVPSLAVVTRGEGRWHLLVRGAGRVEVLLGDAITVVEEPEVLTWSESTVTAADGFRLAFSASDSERADGSQGEGFPCAGGVVAAERVFYPLSDRPWPSHSARGRNASPPPAAEPPVAGFAQAGLPPADFASADEEAAPADRSGAEPETVAVDIVAPPGDLAPADVPERELEALSGAKIVLAGGRVVELDGPVLLGRAPRASAVPDVERPVLVTLPRASADVSRSHLLVEFQGGAVSVTDIGSRNGTLVTRNGCPAVRLAAGERMLVDRGARLDLGEGSHAVVEASP